MAYSKSLANRVRQSLTGHRQITERLMFGGVGFLQSGNMVVGIWRSSLIARLGRPPAAEALQQPFVREFDITGRPMTGWIMVEPDGLDSDEQLATWVERALDFVATLPPK